MNITVDVPGTFDSGVIEWNGKIASIKSRKPMKIDTIDCKDIDNFVSLVCRCMRKFSGLADRTDWPILIYKHEDTSSGITRIWYELKYMTSGRHDESLEKLMKKSMSREQYEKASNFPGTSNIGEVELLSVEFEL